MWWQGDSERCSRTPHPQIMKENIGRPSSFGVSRCHPARVHAPHHHTHPQHLDFAPTSRTEAFRRSSRWPNKPACTTTFSLSFHAFSPRASIQASHEFWCGCGTTTLYSHGCRASGTLAEPNPEAEGVLGGAIGGDGDFEPGHGTGTCVWGVCAQAGGARGLGGEVAYETR